MISRFFVLYCATAKQAVVRDCICFVILIFLQMFHQI